MEQKKRLVYLDALRILAIMCVIFNHSGNNGFFLYTTTDNVLVQVVSIFISSFCKIGVLLFFMISGALLLGKEESIKELYLKRVLRYIIILFVFSFIRYIYLVHNGQITFGWKDLIRKITTGQIYTPYWFLYSYLSFLISLPILRKIAKTLNTMEYLYLFVLYVISGGIFGVLARTFLGQIVIAVPFTADVIIYPLLGYFIAYKIPKEKETLTSILIACIAAFSGLCINDFITEYDYHIFGGWTEGGLSLFVIFSAAAVFLIAKYFFEHIHLPAFLEQFICTLGSCTFGVYLMECYIKDYFGFIQKMLTTVMPRPVAAFLYLFCILLIGAAITYVLKKIPVIRKLL